MADNEPRMAALTRFARPWICVPLALAVFACGCGRLAERIQGKGRVEFGAEVDAMLAGGSASVGAADSSGRMLWTRLAAFYHDRHRDPVWSTGDRLRPEAGQLLE